MSLENHHYDQLDAIRRRFENKRTLGYQLLDECLRLVESAVAEGDARAAGRIEQAEASVQRYETVLESMRNTNRRWEASCKDLQRQLDEKRTLREERQAEGEEVKVTIGRSQGSWKVGDLEEVAYRLRCGGADDETPVKMSEWAASALVPAPNMVPLTRPTRVPPPERPAPLPDPVVVEDPWLTGRQLFVGAVAAMVAVVVCIVIGAVL